MKKLLAFVTLVSVNIGLNAQQNQIEATGNVGIGTTSPTEKLDVRGLLKVPRANNQDNNSPGITALSNDDFLYDGEYINQYGFGFHGFQDGTTGFVNPLNTYVSGHFGIDFFTASGNKMRISRNGNVGIGTSTPSEKLEVKGIVKIERANAQDNNSPGLTAMSNDDFLYDGEYINQYGFGFHGFQDGTTSFVNPLNTYVSGHFGIDFFTASGNKMRISRNGNVGIGTSNPDMKLTVNGNIHAKEVKIDLNIPAPDYVFTKSYDLRSIEEVENYIKKHSHLPEIPSAQEFKQNGVLLAEMDMNLLKKIEELTLYTIQQQKEIEQQNSALAKQEKEILELKSMVKMLLESKK